MGWEPLGELAVPAGCASDGLEVAARAVEPPPSELAVPTCCEGWPGGRRAGHGAAGRVRSAGLRREAVAALAVRPLAELAVPACSESGGPVVAARAVEPLAEPAA